jgi:hypothetical protein
MSTRSIDSGEDDGVCPIVAKGLDPIGGFRCDRDEPLGCMIAVAIAGDETVIGRAGVTVVVREAVEQCAEGADRREVSRVEQDRVLWRVRRVCGRREERVDGQRGDACCGQLPPRPTARISGTAD